MIKAILNSENPLVLRVDFTNQAIWEEICRAVQEPVDGFYAYIEFLNDPMYEGVTQENLRTLIPDNYNHCFIIIVDRIAISDIDHPLLIVDLAPGSKMSFRATPSAVQSIENNLSIGNMSFEEFISAVDENGIFRGFFDGQ